MKKFFLKLIFLFLAITVSSHLFAAEDNYNSQFMNQSNQAGQEGYTLVKTRVWPESGCVIDSGPKIVRPGENSKLTVAKKKECDQAGIGYSFYHANDKKMEHLLGYVSHRFRDGKFSLQISVFCESNKCVFRDLNPEQNRH